MAKQTGCHVLIRPTPSLVSAFVTVREQEKGLDRLTRPVVTTRHGYRGRRPALCDDSEELLNASIGVAGRCDFVDVSTTPLVILDFLLSHPYPVSLSFLAEQINTSSFYQRALQERQVSERGLRMWITRLRESLVEAARGRVRAQSFIRTVEERCHKYHLAAIPEIRHVRLD